MILYLLRHGEAVANATSDKERSLSPKGQKQVEELAGWMKQDNHLPDQIMASPYLRAQQTATHICRGLSLPDKFLTSDKVTPDADVEQAFRELNKLKVESVLIVSHMPFVGDFMALLLDTDDPYGFPPAGLACLDVDAFVPGGATLLWFHGPSSV